LEFPNINLEAKQFDLIKIILGIGLFIVAGLFSKYLILQTNFNNFPLVSIISIAIILGLFFVLGTSFFISGYTDMQYHYNLETDLQELKFLSEFISLRKNLKSNINKTEIKEYEKINNYIEDKINKIIKNI